MSKMLGKVADLERQLNGERKAKENAEKKIAELLDAPGKTTTAEESGNKNHRHKRVCHRGTEDKTQENLLEHATHKNNRHHTFDQHSHDQMRISAF